MKAMILPQSGVLFLQNGKYNTFQGQERATKAWGRQVFYGNNQKNIIKMVKILSN